MLNHQVDCTKPRSRLLGRLLGKLEHHQLQDLKFLRLAELLPDEGILVQGQSIRANGLLRIHPHFFLRRAELGLLFLTLEIGFPVLHENF